jgi:hypothetical protein
VPADTGDGVAIAAVSVDHDNCADLIGSAGSWSASVAAAEGESDPFAVG